MNSKGNEEEKINNDNNKTGIEELDSKQRGCWQSLFGYFGGNSDENTKNEKEGENKDKNQISSSDEIK